AYRWRAGSALCDGVEGRLTAAGLHVPVAVMQSNGGTFGPAEARARPVVLAQSGPVAGVSAARALAEAADLGDVITADMGGTSFDVAVIHRGEPERRVRAEVFGLATAMPMVAVSSVGAGGGSIAWQDARGMLRVGPRSAGADPGPACYGRGGQEPAVTDALVALGLLDPGNFLGGRLVLDGESAVAALGRLGRAVGLDAEGTARGVYRLSHEQMTLAVKGLLVERGLDPRRFTLLCYGGCGPLFGAPTARAPRSPDRRGSRRCVPCALCRALRAGRARGGRGDRPRQLPGDRYRPRRAARDGTGWPRASRSDAGAPRGACGVAAGRRGAGAGARLRWRAPPRRHGDRRAGARRAARHDDPRAVRRPGGGRRPRERRHRGRACLTRSRSRWSGTVSST